MHFKDSSSIQHGVPEGLIHETDSRFRLVVRKHHSYLQTLVLCLWNINILQLQVLLLYFSSSPLCTVGCFFMVWTAVGSSSSNSS